MVLLWLYHLLVAGLCSAYVPHHPGDHRHIKEDCSSLYHQMDVLKGTLKCGRLPVNISGNLYCNLNFRILNIILEFIRKLCSSNGMRTIDECVTDSKDSSKASDCLLESLKVSLSLAL